MAKSSTMARIPREVHAEVTAIAEEKGLTFGEALRIWQQQTVAANESQGKHSVSHNESGGFSMSQESQHELVAPTGTREIVHRVHIDNEQQNNRLDRLEDAVTFLAGEVSVNRSGIHTMNTQLGSGGEYDAAQTVDVMRETREKLQARGLGRLAGYLEDESSDDDGIELADYELVEDDE